MLRKYSYPDFNFYESLARFCALLEIVFFILHQFPSTPIMATPATSGSSFYIPQTDKMREKLSQVKCKSPNGEKRLMLDLYRFDLTREQLTDLMGEEGFFPGFTEAQKLWYIDATLYDTYCMLTHSLGSEDDS